ncbi:hypothetical protein E2562_031935 [Oryza meyeriana var. granulata]|uniref:Uncharacterized protein n=1 Tax=Oryza meyeriana var. granulata TaxID=110450 RepID=A0A6G1F0C0_9ORYZ|nr:hypothetical protein E2562_031935 [Oryza meyeriana var. granulata]
MNGSLDPTTVFLVSSGCAILPDCLDSFPLQPAATADQANSSSAAIISRSRTGGSFITVTYQMLLSSQGCNMLKNATNMFKAALETHILT